MADDRVGVVLVFVAMLSVYGYFAESWGRSRTHMGSTVSAMLMAFDIVVIVGNFILGSLSQRNS